MVLGSGFAQRERVNVADVMMGVNSSHNPRGAEMEESVRKAMQKRITIINMRSGKCGQG